MLWFDLEPVGGDQEYFGIGLAVRDLVTSDENFKVTPKAGVFEKSDRRCPARGSGHCSREAEFVQPVDQFLYSGFLWNSETERVFPRVRPPAIPDVIEREIRAKGVQEDLLGITAVSSDRPKINGLDVRITKFAGHPAEVLFVEPFG